MVGDDAAARAGVMIQKADMTSRAIGPVIVEVSTQAQAVERIKAAVDEAIPGGWGFCNAHTVNIAYESGVFREAIARMTMFNDGVGLDLASKILHGAAFPDNVNGTDLTPVLLDALGQRSLFLVGSAPGVAEEAAANIEREYSRITVVGVQHGFFAEADEPDIAARIVQSGADLVLVGMGHPRQEIWAAQNVAAIPCPLLCIGAYIDRAAGKIPRPPLFVRKLRCEWLFRLVLEPRRLARRYIVGNAVFLMHVMRERRLRQSAGR